MTTARPRHRTPLGRAVTIGLVVGSVLVLVNHGDHLAAEPCCRLVYLKVALSYLTPFVVSLASSRLAARDLAQPLPVAKDRS